MEQNYRREKRPSNKSYKKPNYYSQTKIYLLDGSVSHFKYNHHSEHHNKQTKPITDDFSEIKSIKYIPVFLIDEEFTWINDS